MNLLKLNKMCRVCLNLISNSEMRFTIDEMISLKLNACGGIMINEVNAYYPRSLCENCYNNLESAYNFRITCDNTEKTLKKFVEHQTTNINEKFLEIFNECDSISPEYILSDTIDINFNRDLTCENKDNNILSNEIIKEQFSEEQILIKANDKIESKKKLKNKIKKCTNNRASKNENVTNVTDKRKCSKKSSSISTILTKDKKYVCESCNLEYKGKSSLIYHMRRHMNELNYVCEICGIAFETNFKLKRHVLKHMGTLPYPCRSCDMKFSSSSNRDRHERRLHTTFRPFACSYCEKAFSYSDQLKTHIRVHTGEKPYVCEKCGSAFKRKSHLSAHSNSLTPCIIKMTLKNKIVGEKTKLQKITSKNAIKNKSFKSVSKRRENVPEKMIQNIVTEQQINESINQVINDSNKLTNDYINLKNVDAIENVKQELPNFCVDYEEQLNLCNLSSSQSNINLKQNSLIKKEIS